MSTKHISAFLKSQSSRARRPLNLSIVLSFGAGIVLIIQMGILAFCVDSVLTHKASLTDLLFLLPPLVILFFTRAILSYFSERLALKAAIDLKHAVRGDLLRRLIAKGPILERGSENAVGDQVTMLTEGIEALEGYFARYMPAMVMTVLLPFAILAVTLSRDWLSAVVMVVTAPLIPVFMILIGKGTEKLNQKQWRKLARLSAHFLDMIQGLTTLKLFNASRREAETVSRMAESYRRTTMSVLRVAFLSSLVLEFFATVSIAIIAVFIGFRLLYGGMTFFDGFYVLLLAPDFYLPLRNMGTHYHARMEAVGAAEAMVSIMEMDDSDAQKGARGEVLPDMQGGIAVEFRSVGFAYPDGTRALEDISFRLDAGQSLALVGPSGSGKSTIIDLILGLARPSEGQILINGHDLASLPLDAWREQLAYVPQKPTLFSGSILDAIRYGLPDASQEKVEAAARQAQAHDFIMTLEDDYQHQLNEKGAGLSGGQIQRIAIARALIRRAPLVLLDEPSAHLDRENEAKVQDALHALEQQASCITIAHRLHTIKEADTILVLEKGKLLETGSHRELMDRDGAYAALVRSGFDGTSMEARNG
ncbi:thiol reductant ABC exporter subunit CydD [uncultured Cohaesibacter sp.]|uniref:thiol reductant ABC exporter subunit CydD n=1 Tax=uncultured Cohaesibacter sp. TaxID=1002546 RepID=UPI0029C78A73|nr:thiol reductant ABC exporter subunit CydD [uncultured Cohaesibacter sp.]